MISIPDILLAYSQSDRVAILTPESNPLSYRQLYQHIQTNWVLLNKMGVGKQSRVAVIMPEGPELATAFLTIAHCAACIPLNPSFTVDEFCDYFSQVKATHLLIQNGLASPARQAAQQSGINIIELEPQPHLGAGIFTLLGTEQLEDQSKYAEVSQGNQKQVTSAINPDDPALILTTSGTTSRPKILALSHRLLCVRVSLRLPAYKITEQDRLLNIMPMFHSSSLTHFLLSLYAGASVICVRGFYAKDFLNWVEEYQPTWCSATASMYQTVLTYAEPRQGSISSHLRFMRAGSMALPTTVWEQMEKTFGVPILQGYSSTETGAIAANPLPPLARKPASVGLPLIETAIIDEHGNRLPHDTTGEIIVTGPSIINGYEGDQEVTQKAFINGWYRTGDSGYFDRDGYLYLTGRIKEVINRGGEKIFPGEVEKALCLHPAVQEAVVFSVPDKQLGEAVGAAVIPVQGIAVEEKLLRTFVAAHIAVFKVPRYIRIVEEFPKTATGKIQRKDLAKQFGLDSASEAANTSDAEPSQYSPPTTRMENDLVTIWADLLGHSPDYIGIHTQFQALGGDSLTAARMISRIRQTLHVEVTMLDLFDKPTIHEQANVLDSILGHGNYPRADRWLIPIRATATYPPLFCIHALQGGVFMYSKLLPFLDSNQAVYGLQAMGFDGVDIPFDNVESIVEHHSKQIRSLQPEGPYYLCGFSFGGRLALGIAQKLKVEYHQLSHVLIIDDHLQVNRDVGKTAKRSMFQKISTLVFALLALPAKYKYLYLQQRYKDIAASIAARVTGQTRTIMPQASSDDRDAHLPPEVRRVKDSHKIASKRYQPQPYDGDITYLRAAGDQINVQLFKTLRRIARGKLVIIDVPGIHSSLMRNDIQGVGEQIALWREQSKRNVKQS